MTQRLTPERIEEIRARVMSPVGVTWFGRADDDSRALLAEIDALRAELAGAEERGRQLERAAVGSWLYDEFAHAAAKYHMAREAVRDAAEAIERGDHVRTGTTPPDAAEPGP